MKPGWLAAAPILAAAWSLPLFAQTEAEQRERLKKEVMEEVEKILQREEARVLESVDRLLREEFGKLQGRDGPSAPAKSGGRGYLGIRPSPLSEDERQELELEEEAVRIAEVLGETPAEAAGLEVEDIILRLDGKPFAGVEGLVEALSKAKPGDKVALTILRDGERKQIEAHLSTHPEDAKEEPKKGPEPPAEPEQAERQAPPQAPPGIDELMEQLRSGRVEELWARVQQMLEDLQAQGGVPEELLEQFRRMLEGFGGEGPPAPKPESRKEARPYLGVLVVELTPEEADQAELEEGEGLLVSEVREGSSAQRGGVRAGDILIELNGKRVRGETSLQETMRNAKVGDKLAIVVLRQGKKVELGATLEPRPN